MSIFNLTNLCFLEKKKGKNLMIQHIRTRKKIFLILFILHFENKLEILIVLVTKPVLKYSPLHLYYVVFCHDYHCWDFVLHILTSFLKLKLF